MEWSGRQPIKTGSLNIQWKTEYEVVFVTTHLIVEINLKLKKNIINLYRKIVLMGLIILKEYQVSFEVVVGWLMLSKT